VTSGEFFKPIELADRDIFKNFLIHDHPGISECSFTNLFVWKRRYNPLWTVQEECLLLVCLPGDEEPFALPPVGTGDRVEGVYLLMEAMADLGASPRICRVPESFISAYLDHERFFWSLDRDNSDYIYFTRDLIELSGNRLHKKKNHLNHFMRHNVFEYRPMDLEMIECVLDMQEEWCQVRECIESNELVSEDYAIRQALTHFEELNLEGGVIVMGGKVEAFSLGELLTSDTAVIHFEKANPSIPGLYAAINQLFCSHAWPLTTYINREQDLGKEGLRRAKESYRPHHMLHKFTVLPLT